MLPFLKPKAVAGLIIAKRKPDGGKTEQYSEGNEDIGLDSCGEDLIRALEAKDAQSVSAALRAAFEILNSESPSQEGPQSNDYDSQNAKAAQSQKE